MNQKPKKDNFDSRVKTIDLGIETIVRLSDKLEKMASTNKDCSKLIYQIDRLVIILNRLIMVLKKLLGGDNNESK